MVNVYTKYPDSETDFIKKPDEWFKFVSLKDFDDKCVWYLKELEGAEILDLNTDCVKTPFGVTNISSLSTGFKALVIARLKKNRGEKAVICVNECGENIVKYITEEVDNSCIGLYMSYCAVTLRDKHKFKLNDSKIFDGGVELLGGIEDDRNNR